MLAKKAQAHYDPFVLEPSSKGEAEGDLSYPSQLRHGGTVDRGIHRSGFPNPANFRFSKTIELRSILCLCLDPYPVANKGFLRENGITLFKIEIYDPKEATIPEIRIREALKIVLGSKHLQTKFA